MVYKLLCTTATRLGHDSHTISTRLAHDRRTSLNSRFVAFRRHPTRVRTSEAALQLRSRNIGRMADQTLTRLLAKARAGHSGRSEAYSWLRAKFEQLYPLLKQRKLTFQQVADDLALSGKRGGRGKPITAHAACEIWKRVKHDTATEEPWRLEAVRAAMQRGRTAQKPDSRGHERGANAERPPVAVTTPTPRPPVPHYQPPPQSTPLTQSALHSRPDAASSPSGALQTNEERLAHLKATIERRNRHF